MRSNPNKGINTFTKKLNYHIIFYSHIMTSNKRSTQFLDNFFEFLPEDMQREIINRCYKRPHPKYCYGDMVEFVSMQQAFPSTTTQTYYDTERPTNASNVYCVMMNPVWKDIEWTWQYMIREFRLDNSRYYSTEFIGNIRENENFYLHDCAFILNEPQMSRYYNIKETAMI